MNRTTLHSGIVAACLDGKRPVLFVTGEAGIGKSTLLRSVKEYIRATSGTTRIADVDCSAPIAGVHVGAVEALHPWIQLMRELATDAPTQQTRELVTDLARAWIKFVPIVGDLIESTVETISIVREHRTSSASTEQAVSREHVFQQCIGFFTALAARSRLVLIIDDAHWADDSSLNLLFALARASQGNIVCVVAYRPDDVRTSRDGGEHALMHVERELTRYDLCETIVVDPMSADEVESMIGPVASRVDVASLTRFCGGNPLVVSGVVDLFPTDGRVDLDTVDIPRSAEAIIQERLRRLSSDLRDVLGYAAVEGETFTSPMLQLLCGLAPLPLAQHLRRAEQDHMLVRSLGKQRTYVADVPTYEFSNVLVHRALYAKLGTEERELIHGAIATELERMLTGTNRLDNAQLLHRLAAHYGAMGDDANAAACEVDCAKAAWRYFAIPEVLALLERALHRQGIGTATKAAAFMLRGTVKQFQRELPMARSDYESARAIFLSLADDERVVDIDCRLAACANMDGDPEEMSRLVERALLHAEQIGYQKGISTALSAKGIVAETYGHLDEARSCFERSVVAARSCGDDERLGIALSNIGRLEVVRGQNQAALEHFDQAIEALERVHSTASIARGHNNAGIALFNMQRISEAQERYQTALRLHDTIGDVVGASSLRTNLAQLAYREQRFDDALELIEQSIATKRRIDDHYGLGIALYTRGIVRNECGDQQEGRNDLEEALSIFESIKEQTMIEEVRSVIAQIDQSGK